MSAMQLLGRGVPALDQARLALLQARGVTLSPLQPLGASVQGLDLRCRPQEDVLSALQLEMASRGFLVFQQQGQLSGEEQVTASCYFGGRDICSTHGVHPMAPNEHIFRLSNDERYGILGVGPQWHNDGSFLHSVFSHVGYHIIKVPENGGGTCFSHLGAAYDSLSSSKQEFWSRLVSVNSNSGVVHPVVFTHPITGRKGVYLHLGMTGAVVEHIIDNKAQESENFI